MNILYENTGQIQRTQYFEFLLGGGFKMNIDIQYVVDTMIKYLDIPSPPGNTFVALREVEEQFKAMGIKTTKTKKGAKIL